MKIEFSAVIFKQIIEDTLLSGGMFEHFILTSIDWPKVTYRIMDLDDATNYPLDALSKHIVDRSANKRTVESSDNSSSLCKHIIETGCGLFTRNFAFDKPVSIGNSLNNMVNQRCLYHFYNPLFDDKNILAATVRFSTSWIFFGVTFNPEKTFYSNGLNTLNFKESARSLLFSIYSGDTYLEVYDLKWLIQDDSSLL